MWVRNWTVEEFTTSIAHALEICHFLQGKWKMGRHFRVILSFAQGFPQYSIPLQWHDGVHRMVTLWL